MGRKASERRAGKGPFGMEQDGLVLPSRGKGASQVSSARVGSILQSKARHVAGKGRGDAAAVVRDPKSITFRTFLHNVVKDVMLARGWTETRSELGWDVFWADTMWVFENYDQIKLRDGQRLNHFRNHAELTRKDSLAKNLKKFRRMLEREKKVKEAEAFNFFPSTYNLPAEYGLFVEEFKRFPDTVWIMKPISSAQGKGIFLIDKLSQVAEWKPHVEFKSSIQPAGQSQYGGSDEARAYIVQRYISDPLLIGGKKFDLRIYVLVACYTPMRVYLHRGGFARFSSQRYTDARLELHNTVMHLTNVAVQKKADGYDREKGAKMLLRELRMLLLSRHGHAVVDACFAEITKAVLRSLLAVQPSIINDHRCFELYGYDVMLDSALKPWLIEVNASPSLSAENEADYGVKASVLDDMFSVLDVENTRKGQPAPNVVGGFDLIWGNNKAEPQGEGRSTFTSMLGCHYERAPHIEALTLESSRRRRRLAGEELEDAARLGAEPELLHADALAEPIADPISPGLVV